jgi:hypothetical protein
MEEIPLKEQHFVFKGTESKFIEFRNKENNFLFTRFERIPLEARQEEEKYLYFVYIFRKKYKINSKTMKKSGDYNIICFNKVYHTFSDMVKNLDAILSEYLLNEEDIFECLKLVEELNPY